VKKVSQPRTLPFPQLLRGTKKLAIEKSPATTGDHFVSSDVFGFLETRVMVGAEGRSSNFSGRSRRVCRDKFGPRLIDFGSFTG